MKTTGIGILMAFLALLAPAQDKKALEQRERLSSLHKVTGPTDKAGGTHDKSNIGLFFENRGKLYPHEYAQGPSGSFPITLKPPHEYIYRINPLVGFPGNVIQGRYTTDEEWEAVAGYHNRDSAQIAFSDRPYTWPATGWPVKDASGNPVIFSDQDSYCVYSDSNNSKAMLGIQVNQTGYAFSLKLIQDMIIYKFNVINKSPKRYDSLYFGMYIDIDVGAVENSPNSEYSDDKLDIDRQRNLLYFYDSKGYSRDWGTPTGFFGVAMLQSPSVGGVPLGITDMHYNLYDNDLDRDSIQYGILASAPYLYNSRDGTKYFHLGANAPNLHFDDPGTIPAGGLDLVANIGSGPSTIGPGDTLTFVIAILAGNSKEEIAANTDRAANLVALNYLRPRPPLPFPKITVVPGDGSVNISWDNAAEFSRDPVSGHVFEGYRLYKSVDLGAHWDQIDRNQFPNTSPDPIPLAVFDRIDSIAPDNGLQYSYVDSSVTNGFEYWYSITAYDRGDTLVPSLEDARGNNASAPNLGIAIPRASAIGRTPVSSTPLEQIGTGVSNVRFTVLPDDVPEAAGRTYEIRFAPVARIERGDLRTILSVTRDSLGASTSDMFCIAFSSPATYRLRDLTLGKVLVASGRYLSDSTISISGLRIRMSDTAQQANFRPQAGDSIVISLGLSVTANGSEVLPLQPAKYNLRYATSNGVIISLAPIDPLQSIQQTAGTREVTVRASVSAPDAVTNNLYRLRFDRVYADSARSVFYADISVRNNADSVVKTQDSLSSGGALSFTGFSLTVQFDSTASVGTVVEVRTVKRLPLTYLDAFSFATVGATSNSSTVAAELGRVKVVPNPYLVSSQYEREYGALRREPIRELKFINLPAVCTIYIFTIAGDKVQTIEHNSADGTESWDLRGAGGRVIAPGIYLYLVKTDNAEKLDRFAVIK